MLDYMIMASTEAPKQYTWIASAGTVATIILGFVMLYIHFRKDRREDMTFKDDSLHKRLKLLEETTGRMVDEQVRMVEEQNSMRAELDTLKALQKSIREFIRSVRHWLTDPRAQELIEKHAFPEEPDTFKDLD